MRGATARIWRNKLDGAIGHFANMVKPDDNKGLMHLEDLKQLREAYHEEMFKAREALSLPVPPGPLVPPKVEVGNDL